MAAPNLIAATTIIGRTNSVSLSNTSTFVVLSNPSNSNKCFKVNTLNVANYSNAAVSVTIGLNDAANVAGNNFVIAGGIVVPAGSTLNLIDKTTQYYIEENRSIGASASTGNTLIVTCSYEDIS